MHIGFIVESKYGKTECKSITIIAETLASHMHKHVHCLLTNFNCIVGTKFLVLNKWQETI